MAALWSGAGHGMRVQPSRYCPVAHGVARRIGCGRRHIVMQFASCKLRGLLVSRFIVYMGHLYAGIADANGPKDACRLFRYAGEKRWIDCGRVGNVLSTSSAQSLMVHRGNLYAGTGTWDWTKVQAGIGGPTHVYRYQGGTDWEDCGRVESLASFKGHLYAAANRSTCYRYEGGTTWTRCSNENTRFACMMVYRGGLRGILLSRQVIQRREYVDCCRGFLPTQV